MTYARYSTPTGQDIYNALTSFDWNSAGWAFIVEETDITSYVQRVYQSMTRSGEDVFIRIRITLSNQQVNVGLASVKNPPGTAPQWGGSVGDRVYVSGTDTAIFILARPGELFISSEPYNTSKYIFIGDYQELSDPAPLGKRLFLATGASAFGTYVREQVSATLAYATYKVAGVAINFVGSGFIGTGGRPTLLGTEVLASQFLIQQVSTKDTISISQIRGYNLDLLCLPGPAASLNGLGYTAGKEIMINGSLHYLFDAASNRLALKMS